MAGDAAPGADSARLHRMFEACADQLGVAQTEIVNAWYALGVNLLDGHDPPGPLNAAIRTLQLAATEAGARASKAEMALAAAEAPARWEAEPDPPGFAKSLRLQAHMLDEQGWADWGDRFRRAADYIEQGIGGFAPAAEDIAEALEWLTGAAAEYQIMADQARLLKVDPAEAEAHEAKLAALHRVAAFLRRAARA